MYPDSYIPQRLVKYFRDGLVEQEHLGFVVSSGFEFGETFGYPFYLRSCAKPIQASLILDYDLDFTEEEITLMNIHFGNQLYKNFICEVNK